MKKTKVILKIIVGFIYFLTPLLTIAQEAAVEESIRTIMSQTNVVGVSVAVVKNNKIIYTHSFGLKNIETNTPLTDDCIFRIASISKSFSATSIMQLVEAKKLSLEDDASNLLGFT